MKPAWQSGAGFSTLAVAGVLALNYPLLALFDRNTQVFGIPLLFLHVFVVWALLIAGLAVMCERGGNNGANRDSTEDNVGLSAASRRPDTDS
ncbi:hypothetical protein [Granulosicoccus antarcticus]|uniref:Uncharacterized protein n=1 Tax=Granulosicoccus antarcticus IMCC3135 TaxID=1192854 RepID=A0A2Z2NNS2_9GAMM|nr:hypothetical protein [Granulosicoccus antarcticus]ASJ73122.1 hypothetical protein IMCC3135_15190 [Granulosicoccus antarcticus IMCC3135]